MSYRCDKCGSRNHVAFDCVEAYNGWKEREPISMPLPLKPDIVVEKVCSVITKKTNKKQFEKLNSAVLSFGLSGPLPVKSGDGSPFPFVRKGYWDKIRGESVQTELKQQKVTEKFTEQVVDKPLQKKAKPVQSVKQEVLF